MPWSHGSSQLNRLLSHVMLKMRHILGWLHIETWTMVWVEELYMCSANSRKEGDCLFIFAHFSAKIFSFWLFRVWIAVEFLMFIYTPGIQPQWLHCQKDFSIFANRPPCRWVRCVIQSQRKDAVQRLLIMLKCVWFSGRHYLAVHKKY